MTNTYVGLDELRKSWGWLLALGLLQIVVGAMAISSSWVATYATVKVFGALLVIGAVFQGLYAFTARRWSGFFLLLLFAVLQGVVGCFMLANPLRAAAELTLLIAAFLVAGGVIKMIASVVSRFPNWGWVFLNGLIGVVLGVMLIQEWPASGLWFIGFCFGLELLFHGWSWVMFALALKSRPLATV
ncbi:MAG: DUF308 domain-containing protein [Gemmataceae bacterium]